MTKILMPILLIAGLLQLGCESAGVGDFETRLQSQSYTVFKAKGRSCKNQIEPPTEGDIDDVEGPIVNLGRFRIIWNKPVDLQLQVMSIKFSGSNVTTTAVDIDGARLAALWTGVATGGGFPIINANAGTQYSSNLCSFQVTVPIVDKLKPASGLGEIFIQGVTAAGEESEFPGSYTSFSFSYNPTGF